MKILVLGANGATGFNFVNLLLNQGFDVKALVRNVAKFDSIENRNHLELIRANILDIEKINLKQHLEDVDALISCLGHNISFKGIFGKPHKLVVDSIIRIAEAIKEIGKNQRIKLILMNTTACLNKEQKEKFENNEKFIMKIMKFLLPPQRDNELALEYLFDKIGTKNNQIEWVAVRPDTLINENEVSEYTIHQSTIRSPLFNAGKTSRINVADFMVKLLKENELWEKWKFKTPVIYNFESR